MSCPREMPPDAAEFRGVSQGGCLVWTRKSGGKNISRLPESPAEIFVSLEHRLYGARLALRWDDPLFYASPEWPIWVDTIRHLQGALESAKEELDMKDVITLGKGHEIRKDLERVIDVETPLVGPVLAP